jgi:quinohemoprotein ethanol dehydrogenase
MRGWILTAQPFLLALALTAQSGCSNAVGRAESEARGASENGTAENWEAPGGAADESSYSRLAAINTGTVGRLGLAWSLDLPDEVTLEGTPVAANGKLFFSGSHGAVYAVDGASGRLLWKFDPETWKRSPQKLLSSFGVHRGVAYENGKVFVAALDGRLFALDAATGKIAWQAASIPEGMVNDSTGAPRTMNGKVIIGTGGAEFGSRGFVTAFDAVTGKQLWRFFLVPGSPEQNKGDPVMETASATWTGEWWKRGGGGTAWNGMTFDPELDRVYIGAGNAAPFDAALRSPRGGDNLFTSSIVALDAKTGKYIWHYQETPRETWDYKATPNIVSTTLPIDGKPRAVLLHAPTNGFFYVLDRNDGTLISTGRTTRINWTTGIDPKTGRPIDVPGSRFENGCAEIWPGMIGGHNWQAMAYSPRTRLAYIPIQQLGSRLSRQPLSQNAFFLNDLWYEPIIKADGDGKGYLVAWDPIAQQARWTVRHDTLWNGGTLATAGDLVFQGTADGWFAAYGARDGKPTWRFNAGLGIVGAPMSYAVGGRQYVAVLVGYGGVAAAYGSYMNVGWKYRAQTRRLLAFALDGKAVLPPGAPADFTVHALDDSALVLDKQDVLAGRTLSMRCGGCHGVGLQAVGTPGPDLRESPIALDFATFRQFLKVGRMERGMPRYDMLSDEQVRQLHAYIRARAREALKLPSPSNLTTPVPASCPTGPAGAPSTMR